MRKSLAAPEGGWWKAARPHLRSVRSRLLLLTLALLLPALAAGGLLVYAGYRHDRQAVEKHLQETARALSLVVDRQFGQAEALLWALSTSPQLLEKDYAAFDARARAAIRLPGAWVSVADDRGQVVNTRLPPGSPLPLIDNRDHRKGLTVGTLRVSNLFSGLVAKQPTVGIDTLVRTDDGSELYISVNMLADTITRILADQGLPPTWIGAILDRNGTVVARSRDAAQFVGRPATPENVERVRAGMREGVAESISLDGVQTLLALARSPGSGWSTIVAVPRSEITAPAWRSALYLALAGGLLLALGLAMAWKVGRSIAGPVMGLAGLAQHVGRGEPITAPASGLVEIDRVTDALASASMQLQDADRRQKLLIDELNHRVKNTLATVQSLSWQVMRQGVSPQVAHERFQQRLLALSRTHNLLNETLWEGASIRTILEAEFKPYAADSARVRLDGPSVDLPARLAVVLGMAFHELATNAVKYGALSTASGRVQVDWKLGGSGDEAVLVIDWCEVGGPALEAEPVPGFGSRLLRQTIAHELAGQLDLRFEREGVCCTMTISLQPAGRQAA
ncbi:sensor histidine kinase [Microvirga subterranea]|uniref:histidine kinase n=1 Tax=Microvirga subterranea TaxID=186651 RepID=A0A370HJC0_9HYPH|nr:sensor histidine kinase [Microvirga subterranea]RDI58055.1 two-component sensor histidine kinase [Microvirga subterranea]